MDRTIWKYRARRNGILRTCSFLACSFLLVPICATGGGVEVNGSSTSIDKAGNGVPVVNIARPNKRGLSHNKYKRFNVKKKGLILNNSSKATVNTQLGGQIKGNTRLNNSASVILNEVTSTHPSKLEGYTEVAGQRADIVIANPNGISINGAGFINSSRVTLTTGIPSIDAQGNLAGFDVQGGSIRIEGDGLDTLDQDATSIYSHYLQLNANLHARDLDIALGVNQIDYPGRKIVSSRDSGNVKRVLLDSSLLGGMYANKIVLVGTDKGLGMNLPAQVIASTGDIEITADGRLRLQQLDAAGSIRLQSAQAIDSTASVYAADRVELRANEEVIVQSGMIAANREVLIETSKLQNDASVFAGVDPDQSLGDVGELNLRAQELVNTGELYASHGLNIDSASVFNRGLLNTDLQLDLQADTLINEATLFSGGDTQLFVRGHLLNAADAVIFTVNDLVLAADVGLGRTGQITNQLGLVQSLQGDIDVFAVNFDNLGTADIDYKKTYYDLGKGRKVDKPSDAKNINLAYSSGYTKHNSEARERWVEEVLERLKRQAPLLYAENAPDIRVNRSARFLAIETQLKNKTTTSPAYLDSGGDLNLHVDKYTNKNSVTSAAGNIHFDIRDDYRNAASSKKVEVTQYKYYTYADHDRNSRSEDKYSSIGHSGYQSVDRSRKVSAETVTQAGGDIDGSIGGTLVNDGVLKGKHSSSAALDPDSYGKSGIVLPSNNFGLFVRVTDPDSRYLIETNPRFTSLGNLTGSDYLLDRLSDGQNHLKLLGDAFYESKLIRERVFALTGQRYLNPSISSDNEQFLYLMDNALLAFESLELSPGIALNSKQINRLSSDIVWLVEQQIDGESVLVPTVYLASGTSSEVSGGKIIAGKQTRLQMATLDNGGLIESGGNLDLEASQAMKNEGLLYAADDLKLMASRDIVNLSGRIEAENIHITSLEGSILNVRDQQNIAYDKGEVNFRAGLLDQAAQINATGVVELNAARKIAVEGSSISGREVSLDARTVSIKSSEESESFSAGDSSDHFKESSNRHFASVINGQDIVILSSGKTHISASEVAAEDTLSVNAGSIVVDAVNDSRFSARQDTIKGQFSLTENSKHSFRSENVGSKLSGATVVLVTDQGDIEITGSEINASEHLTLASARNIRIQAGQQDKIEESYRRKSQLFSGGALYTESDDLEGRMVTRAVKSQINAGSVDMNAAGDIEMTGVDIGVAGELTASARDIVVRNATDEKTRYTRSTEIRIGSGDFEDSLSLDVDAFDDDDGRLRFKLTDAEYHDLDSVTRKSEVVASQIQAGAIQFNADTSTRGDILIEGSDILAAESIELNAGGNVAILDAHSYSSTESKSKGGTAELNFTVQNEYDQAVRAVKAVREAEHDLRDARKEYDRYQDELDDQQQVLEQLKQDFADGKGFIEQSDVDDFERQLERLEDDEDYYRANIAFASATLVSRVTALIQQTARAAASSGTYGFNASLELDIDAYEREIEEFYQQSRGSSLTANNIEINAGKTATIRGSSLHADEDIVVDARDVEILAGVNTSNRDEMNQHAEFIYRWDMLGGSSTQPPSGVGGSLGGDVSSSNSDTAQHVNSALKGANVRLVAQDDTLIQGAEIAASDSLEITTRNLTIASVQDHDTSKSQSIGASFSSSSAGINASEGDGERIRTRVTRLTGQQVDIQVAGHTELQGAVVAAVDEKGRDNGQLTLTTNTLYASSLNNTVDEKNRSISVNGAESSSLDYQDDYLTSRTKSLATLGSGEINIENTEKSDVRFLNRDITDTEVAIYDIESHRGLSGEIDTRLLTEDGRKEIAEDWLKTKMIGNTLELIVLTRKVGVEDFFAETEKHHTTYETIKQEIAQDPELAAALQNPNLSAEQKELMLDQLTGTVMVQLGYEEYENKIISTTDTGRGGEQVYGFYSTEANQAFINDYYLDNTSELVTTAGHEATRAMDDQDNIDFDLDRQDRYSYAINYGENFSAYTDQALQINGYSQGMAESNNHVGNNSSAVNFNNQVFQSLDKSKGDNYLAHSDKVLHNKLIDALFDCSAGSGTTCSASQKDEMSAVVNRLLQKDLETDAQLTRACKYASSSACREEVDKLKDAFDSYLEQSDTRQVFNDGTLSEYVEVATLYGEYRSQAMSENARRALVNIPIDAVTGTVDLATVVAEAIGGSEEAKTQLSILAESVQDFVSSPVTTIEQNIAHQLAEADQFEAAGDINKAEEIRSKVFLEGAFTITGVTGGALTFAKTGLNTTTNKTDLTPESSGFQINSIDQLPGPDLSEKIRQTFKDGVYTNRRLNSDSTFFKYHGINNRTGKKEIWVTDRKYESESDLRKALAIRDDWGVNITRVTKFLVPKGTWVSEGLAASQGGQYIGGGYQAVILNLPRSQIKQSGNAFND